MKLTNVRIHPQTAKHISLGHPWITLDSFSKSFPKKEDYLQVSVKNKELVFINDPSHPQIKARYFATKSQFLKSSPIEIIQLRIQKAIKKREKLQEFRDNFYIVFGEVDLLPGLKILKIKDQLIFEVYSNYWNQHKNLFIDIFKKDYALWWQARNSNQKLPAKPFGGLTHKPLLEIEEFGVKYNIELNTHYDKFIYTDISSIRSQAQPIFKSANSVLNLYAYTGAFSLFALKNEAKEVISVDLSEEYVKVIEKNINLNQFDISRHQSMVSSVEVALKKLSKTNKLFDLIIIDPPSFSSNGKKTTSSFQSYQNLWTSITKLLSPNAKILAFLNTHQITRNKFKKKLEELISKDNKNLKIIENFTTKEDAPTLKGFPEGSYLKCFVIQNMENK